MKPVHNWCQRTKQTKLEDDNSIRQTSKDSIIKANGKYGELIHGKKE